MWAWNYKGWTVSGTFGSDECQYCDKAKWPERGWFKAKSARAAKIMITRKINKEANK